MSKPVSNNDLMKVLMEISGDMGAVKSDVATLKGASTNTLQDVKELQLNAARQKGVMAALAAVGALLGSGVGYAIDLFARHH